MKPNAMPRAMTAADSKITIEEFVQALAGRPDDRAADVDLSPGTAESRGSTWPRSEPSR